MIAYLQRKIIKDFSLNVKNKIIDNLTEFANRWKGVKEIGQNTSFQNDVFQTMLRNVGWVSGQAWCMYFAKAVHYEIYVTDRPQIKKILTGNTQTSYNNAKNDKTGTYTVSDKPDVGDIVIWQLKTNPDKGHAGLVTKILENNKIETLEGNTSYESAREGDTIEKKTRNSKVGSRLGDLTLRGYIKKV